MLKQEDLGKHTAVFHHCLCARLILVRECSRHRRGQSVKGFPVHWHLPRGFLPPEIMKSRLTRPEGVVGPNRAPPRRRREGGGAVPATPGTCRGEGQHSNCRAALTIHGRPSFSVLSGVGGGAPGGMSHTRHARPEGAQSTLKHFTISRIIDYVRQRVGQ